MLTAYLPQSEAQRLQNYIVNTFDEILSTDPNEDPTRTWLIEANQHFNVWLDGNRNDLRATTSAGRLIATGPAHSVCSVILKLYNVPLGRTL